MLFSFLINITHGVQVDVCTAWPCFTDGLLHVFTLYRVYVCLLVIGCYETLLAICVPCFSTRCMLQPANADDITLTYFSVFSKLALFYFTGYIALRTSVSLDGKLQRRMQNLRLIDLMTGSTRACTAFAAYFRLFVLLTACTYTCTCTQCSFRLLCFEFLAFPVHLSNCCRTSRSKARDAVICTMCTCKYM